MYVMQKRFREIVEASLEAGEFDGSARQRSTGPGCPSVQICAPPPERYHGSSSDLPTTLLHFAIFSSPLPSQVSPSTTAAFQLGCWEKGAFKARNSVRERIGRSEYHGLWRLSSGQKRKYPHCILFWNPYHGGE
jgi:hypothetical protein